MDRPGPDVDEARRAALLKMGRFAAYTAPAMTALLVADRAGAAASAGGCRGVNPGRCSNPNPHFRSNDHPVFGSDGPPRRR